MKAATGHAAGPQPNPELAEAAVRMALERAGLTGAEHVLLLLSREFAHHPGPAILAAARTAGCLQVTGCTASGVFTEQGWLIDQPAAVALVLTGSPAKLPDDEAPILSFTGQIALPLDWRTGAPRVGLLDAEAATWSHGRMNADGRAEFRLPAPCVKLSRSNGLRRLGKAQAVDLCASYELRQIGGSSAVASLRRALPAELRERPPIHQLALLRPDDAFPITILSGNADGSLTLAEPVQNGEHLTWAIRQALVAEQQIRSDLKTAAEAGIRPDFGLMFSCIARGPLFYGGDDLDLQAFRQQFPDTPLLGAYGSGQIAPTAAGNHLFQNSAITLLFKSEHV